MEEGMKMLNKIKSYLLGLEQEEIVEEDRGLFEEYLEDQAFEIWNKGFKSRSRRDFDLWYCGFLDGMNYYMDNEKELRVIHAKMKEEGEC